VAAVASRVDVAVDSLDVAAYTIPTEEPESDGTLEWDSTTIVAVQAHAGDETGLGYTYADLVTQAPGLAALVKRAAGMAPGCFSCKTQIEQAGTDRRALHLAQVIGMALGGGVAGPYPERALPERPKPSVGRRARRLALAGAPFAVAAGGYAAARRRG
jgi:hypothetical protein